MNGLTIIAVCVFYALGWFGGIKYIRDEIMQDFTRKEGK